MARSNRARIPSRGRPGTLLQLGAVGVGGDSAALVDWAATQKAEADQESRRQELDKQIADSESVSLCRFGCGYEFRGSVECLLPDGVGFYALDGNKIAVMQQEQAEIHTEKGRAFERIATGIPISAKQDMEILEKKPSCGFIRETWRSISAPRIKA